MSWWIYAGIDTGGNDPEGTCLTDGINCTYNLGTMFYEALGGDPCDISFRDLHMAPFSELGGVIENAIRRMEENPKHFKEFNPANGWGDYDGALNILRTIRSYCISYPKGHLIIH